MSSIREIVEDAYSLKQLEWKPLYPNNMPCNLLSGYYALKLLELEKGVVGGRKYTILFQQKTDEEGMILSGNSEIEYYSLFEKSYDAIVGNLEHPKPCNEDVHFEILAENTLNSLEVNDYGTFSWVCKSLDEAKERAVKNYQAVFGYALSHIL